MQIAEELKSVCSKISESNNTSCLYKFKENVDKCINDKKIDNRELIIQCIHKLSGLIPSKLLSQLVAKAIELKDKDLCFVVLENVLLLEEAHAVDFIKFILSGIEFKQDELMMRLPLDIEHKLDILFEKKFDYRMMSGELKRLSSNEFILCLQYLQNNVKKAFQDNLQSNQSTYEIEKMETNQKVVSPNILQITNLFSCFVDAHFTHITLSDKSQEIIADVLQLIENQLDIFFDLISIDSLIKEIKQNKDFQIKNTNHNSDYFIEVLKLE